MKIRLILISLIFLFVISCRDAEITQPEYADGSILEGATPLPDSIKPALEGVYKITDGKDFFGETIALKWQGDKLIAYGYLYGSVMELNAGIKDSVLWFEGIWRHMQNTENGLVRMKISANVSGAILSGSAPEENDFVFDGSYGYGSSPNSRKLNLFYKRPFNPEAIESDFLIIAHRGGGRNSDYLGVSENSVEMIAIAEELGANGIEIDVKLSKDNVPFLYHDPDINLRLVQEAPIWGAIEDFTFPQIRTFLTLVNGEKIPSLREALEYVLENTKLRFVWLDMKSGKNAMPYVIPIQQEFMRRAEAAGRNLKIVIGLPTEDKRELFLQYPGHENILSLNEGDIDEVRATNSYAWGPRWTLGFQSEKVNQMHDEGRIVVAWTVDKIDYIRKFMYESGFDGFVTNYPTIAAYYFYAK